MHTPDPEQRATAAGIAEWAMNRLADRDGYARSSDQRLPAITETGIGVSGAWAALRDQVLASARATDHPRYLAFVAGAPSVLAVLADMAVSAAGVYAGSELEAGAVVAAERTALRWLAHLVGLPAAAHGAFVAGGSMANLSALVVARDTALRRNGRQPGLIVVGASAHSSVEAAAGVMGCRLLRVGDVDRPFGRRRCAARCSRSRPTTWSGSSRPPGRRTPA